MNTSDRAKLSHLGAIMAALGASLCCIVPVLVAVAGVGSAALGAKLEPLRPYFILATVACLGYAFYQAYRPLECEPGDACAVRETRHRTRLILWIVAVLAAILLAFPYYASSLF